MLSAWDLAQLGNKTGATRLGFALLLKFFQRETCFPAPNLSETEPQSWQLRILASFGITPWEQ